MQHQAKESMLKRRSKVDVLGPSPYLDLSPDRLRRSNSIGHEHERFGRGTCSQLWPQGPEHESDSYEIRNRGTHPPTRVEGSLGQISCTSSRQRSGRRSPAYLLSLKWQTGPCSSRSPNPGRSGHPAKVILMETICQTDPRAEAARSRDHRSFV